ARPTRRLQQRRHRQERPPLVLPDNLLDQQEASLLIPAFDTNESISAKYPRLPSRRTYMVLVLAADTLMVCENYRCARAHEGMRVRPNSVAALLCLVNRRS